MSGPGYRPSSTAGERPDELALARSVITHEAAALATLAERLDASFCAACDLIERCSGEGGTVLVAGVGKSGLIGAKISATLASLGVPSHSVHPTEAAHGDLGRFRPADVCLALSFSGETDEVVNLASLLRSDGLDVISITRPPTDAGGSSLERRATCALHVHVDKEASDLGAPTTSTTATLALGDALAACVAARRGFTEAEFLKRHPGGSLGAQLRPVLDVLRFRVPEHIEPAPERLSVREALAHAARAPKSARRPGAVLLVDGRGVLTGIFTDADLRRLIAEGPDRLEAPIAQVMTRSPRTLRHTDLVRDAVVLVREFRADEAPVVDDSGRPVGVLDVQDLVTLRLVSD